ncbi:hypothetical protein ACGVWS_12190 [Enterobacteriaceae bacterium LUAb1]
MANFQWLPNVNQVYNDSVQSITQNDFSKIMGKDFTIISGKLTCNPQPGNNNTSWIWGKADPSATARESKFIFSGDSIMTINGDIDKTTFLFNNALAGNGGAVVTIDMSTDAQLNINNMLLVDTKNVEDVMVNINLADNAQLTLGHVKTYNLSGNINIQDSALFITTYVQAFNASQGTMTVSARNKDTAVDINVLGDFSVTEPEDITAQLFQLIAQGNAWVEISCFKFKILCVRPTAFQAHDNANLDIQCDELICEQGMGGYFELLPGKATLTIWNNNLDIPPPVDIRNKSYAEGLFRFNTNNGTEENYGTLSVEGITNHFDFTFALNNNLFYINGKPVQNSQLFNASFSERKGIFSLFNPKQK